MLSREQVLRKLMTEGHGRDLGDGKRTFQLEHRDKPEMS
jgi:hypothetical protein